jgi:hypothetical protein
MALIAHVSVLAGLVLSLILGPAVADPDAWKYAWPDTDFTTSSFTLKSIMSGGTPKDDGIPTFETVASIEHLADTEPVIGVSIDGDQRANPLQVLMWYEIVNDVVGGVPVSVTFCPLCNTAAVFNRRVDDRVLDVGTTGKLRYSDVVMYDRQTESWWQQFPGNSIIGELADTVLNGVPARIECFARFRARVPEGRVLVPNSPALRRYGANPYAGYDTRARPRLYFGEPPAGIVPLARVVTIGAQAWSLDLVREHRAMRVLEEVIITWEARQSLVLGAGVIAEARAVGNMMVQRAPADGLISVPYRVDLAFPAFQPEAPIHIE